MILEMSVRGYEGSMKRKIRLNTGGSHDPTKLVPNRPKHPISTVIQSRLHRAGRAGARQSSFHLPPPG